MSADLAMALSRLASGGKTVFGVADLAAALGKPARQVWRTLTSLVDRGWVVRLVRGTYLIVPLEAGPESAWAEDSLVVACHLAEPAAVAYWSACHHWNWTEQVPRTVFVQTPARVRPLTREVLGVTYRFVRVEERKFFGTLRRSAGQGEFTVTGREKTLTDALDHPEHSGGAGHVLEMLPTATAAVRWDRVDEMLQRLGSGAVYKRLGWMVERLGERSRVPDREKRIEQWQSRLTGGHAPLEPGGPADGPIVSRWRLRLNVPALAGGGRR